MKTRAFNWRLMPIQYVWNATWDAGSKTELLDSRVRGNDRVPLAVTRRHSPGFSRARE